jgi:hypothetical protein
MPAFRIVRRVGDDGRWRHELVEEGTGGGDGQPAPSSLLMQESVVLLTPQQIANLHTVPVEVIPGISGKAIIPILIVVTYSLQSGDVPHELSGTETWTFPPTDISITVNLSIPSCSQLNGAGYEPLPAAGASFFVQAVDATANPNGEGTGTIYIQYLVL